MANRHEIIGVHAVPVSSEQAGGREDPEAISGRVGWRFTSGADGGALNARTTVSHSSALHSSAWHGMALVLTTSITIFSPPSATLSTKRSAAGEMEVQDDVSS